MAIDYRETVVTVLHSENLDDAARSLNISRPSLAYRLKQLKKAGVKMPTPPRESFWIVSQLLSLIQ